MKPIYSDERLQGWAALWDSAGGRKWCVHAPYNPWIRGERAPTGLLEQAVVMGRELPGGQSAVAVQRSDGRWDVMYGDHLEVADASTREAAVRLVSKRLGQAILEEVRTENEAQRQRIAAR